MGKPPPKSVLAVRLAPSDIDALAQGASHRGLKLSAWVRRVLENQAQADRKSGKAKWAGPQAIDAPVSRRTGRNAEPMSYNETQPAGSTTRAAQPSAPRSTTSKPATTTA